MRKNMKNIAYVTLSEVFSSWVHGLNSTLGTGTAIMGLQIERAAT